MKKFKIAVSTILVAGTSLVFTSCIGSFPLTTKLMDWNKEVGSKFINELVFVAFWILPVYEISGLADLLVLNSIEFWSGEDPLSASVKAVDTDHGRYMISCDGKGYTITHEPTGQSTRLEFDIPSQTWSVKKADGEILPFMTFIDDTHVKMITPSGDFREVELSSRGVMAYSNEVGFLLMASR